MLEDLSQYEHALLADCKVDLEEQRRRDSPHGANEVCASDAPACESHHH